MSAPESTRGPHAVSIALSLIAHTNAGKTTLARTLLQSDVGEVRDEPHVTELSEDHLLVRSSQGDELRLWDTPGLGDSVRLVRRLRLQGRALGWFMTEVWDRWRDRAFWSTQQALHHVREHSHAVLYLVNAAESPEAASYIEAEMELLAWLDKPVLVLLNQLGPPRAPSEEAHDVARWRRHVQGLRAGVQVLPMDAFARCWVQELTLLRAVQSVLDGAQREAMARLCEAWQDKRAEGFEHAMAVLARSLAKIACTRQRIEPAAGLADRAKVLFGRFGPLLGGASDGADPTARARAALAAQLDDDVRASTVELLALHGLEGRAQGDILARVATQFEVRARVPEGSAALVGGMLSGALAGLKADLLSGGLTMGGGLLAGGLLGALGGAGLARGINVMRGGGPPWVGWSAEAMAPMVESALLRYLAVAHFGRGRGQWIEGEAPAHWREVVTAALRPHADALQALWQSRGTRLDAASDAERLAGALLPKLRHAANDALERLYPGQWPAPPANAAHAGVTLTAAPDPGSPATTR
ncbi:MAG: GTPase domain-containing protein [Burkholderiaceae bacterium]|nr:GTPase domain-containing protein [Burkholderiaceae bacterium]